MPTLNIPVGVENVRSYLVGSPDSPVDLSFVCRNGNIFWIHDGVVYRFQTPGSLMLCQDLDGISRFRGKAAFTSNEVVAAATRLISRLAISNNPIAALRPEVKTFGEGADTFPFYDITWPNPDAKGAFGYAASVEIDARTGKAVFMDLRDPGFYQPGAAQVISNNVQAPQTRTFVRRQLEVELPLPKPSEAQAKSAIERWLLLCGRLGLEVGADTNLLNVDWRKCYVYTNTSMTARPVVWQIVFRDGTWFSTYDGIPANYISKDACYSGLFMQRPPEEWARFRGKILQRWQDCAERLEALLITRVGLPKSVLEAYSPLPRFQEPEFGSDGISRVVVDWRDWPKELGTHSVSQTHLAFSAEFDAESGSICWISFDDPKIVRAVHDALHTVK